MKMVLLMRGVERSYLPFSQALKVLCEGARGFSGRAWLPAVTNGYNVYCLEHVVFDSAYAAVVANYAQRGVYIIKYTFYPTGFVT